MRTHPRLRARFLIVLVPCLALPGASPAVAIRGTGGAQARVAVRSGDPAPVSVGVGSSFESLAAAPDALLFIDGAGSALFEKRGTDLKVLAFAGEAVSDRVTIASMRSVAAGSDGSVAFLGLLPDRREGIFRIGPGGGAPEVVVMAQDMLELEDGPATVGVLEPPVVDSDGAVLASVGFLEVPGAIVRFPPGGGPQILIQSGDPLGTGELASPLAAPAVNAAGRIAFVASLATGEDVLGTLDPGGAPVPLIQLPPPSGPLSPVLASIPPAINDAGQVGFLLVDRGTVRVQRAGGGPGFLVAGPGSPAPGGGTFKQIAEFPPAIDPAGRVEFGATRSSGKHGFYLSDGLVSAIAEEGLPAGTHGTFTRIGVDPDTSAAAALGADGVLHLPASASGGEGIFSVGAGSVALEVGGDDPIPGPRFVSFLDSRVPSGGGGPFLAPGGLMIFDARVTGGRRGLFERATDGALRPVALDHDPAPGGGRFVGDRFAYASINDAGTLAFLGVADDPTRAPALSLFYGSIDGGGLRRVIETEPLPAGAPSTGTPGSADRVLGAPSRVDRAGRVAVPLAQPDGTTLLMLYDGSTLSRVAGPGDPAPGGGIFTTAFTGSLFTGQPVPPVLEDDGRLLFGGLTSSGDSALFAARPDTAGTPLPARVLGSGDTVQGGRLSPFELQALDSNGSGRIAFQAIFSDEFDFADFLTGSGPPARLAARFDPILDRGVVLSVLPLLAMRGDGTIGIGVELFDGTEMILAVDPDGGAAPVSLAETAMTAPDGGAYLSFRSGLRSPGRLAADGRGGIALAASTTAGPEEIVLFGPANSPPTAEAGPDLVSECAGPGGTDVTLDGSASTDPDGDPLSYHWTGPFGEAAGPRPRVTLPAGVSTITLVVDDGRISSAPDSVRVEVRDTLPPAIGIAASPSILWPPDGRLAAVSIGLQVSDRCDPRPTVVLLGVASSEPGTGRPGAWITGAATGTDDRLVSLRADRAGSGPGRIYTLSYRAADASGNTTEATTTVSVPHDQGR